MYKIEILETMKGKNDEMDKKKKIFPAVERKGEKERQIECRYEGKNKIEEKDISIWRRKCRKGKCSHQ